MDNCTAISGTYVHVHKKTCIYIIGKKQDLSGDRYIDIPGAVGQNHDCKFPESGVATSGS